MSFLLEMVKQKNHFCALLFFAKTRMLAYNRDYIKCLFTYNN